MLTFTDFVRTVLTPRVSKSKYILVSKTEFAEYEQWLAPQERIFYTSAEGIGGLSFLTSDGVKIVTTENPQDRKQHAFE